MALVAASALVIALGAFASGQRERPPQRPPGFSEGLIVAAAAEDVRYTIREAGIQELGYDVREEYPATRTLSEIRAKVQKRRWRPLKEDLLNPGSPAFREWGAGIDYTVSPQRTVHTWLGQWDDQAGNVLLYYLRYDCPRDDRVHAQYVTVSAAYWPREVAELAKRAAADEGRKR